MSDDFKPILLTSGAYQAKSVLANVQRCINLYMELNPEKVKSPAPFTHYTRPGKTLLGQPPVAGAARNLYRASNGQLFATVNDTVYYIDPTWTFNPLGNIQAGNTPVSMSDNGEHAGNQIVVVDGTADGYIITMTTRAMAPLVDGTGTFVGADVVTYLQTFFLFNWPGTQFWYISQADSATFNALDVAAKVSYPDNIETIGIRQREVWLVGTQTTEPWYLAGGADFPFEAIASTFVSYGIAAKYSMVFADVSLFWISRNASGQRVIVKSEGYEAKAISTRALEAELASYATVEDAIATTYQLEGHTFVVWNFPTANTTWAFDLSTEQWAEFAWTDDDGNLNRDRALFYALAYNTIVGIDWETGALYKIDPAAYNDFGGPISFVRGFPHVLDAMRQITHWAFIVRIQCGTVEDPNDPAPELNMRLSDDGGVTWVEFPPVSMGVTGDFYNSPQFTQLGMARDRVYEIWWSAAVKTAFDGAYLLVDPSET